MLQAESGLETSGDSYITSDWGCLSVIDASAHCSADDFDSSASSRRSSCGSGLVKFSIYLKL